MISKHVSYKEGVYSITATRRGIDNDPNDEQLSNMELIAEKVFEPLREYVGGPIKINSFFRSVKLNKAIGGSSKSQHCKGQAIDIDDTFGVVANSDNNPNWVHVSYVSKEDNRKRCLRAYKGNGKTLYNII